MPRPRGNVPESELTVELGKLQDGVLRRQFLARNSSLVRSDVVRRLAPMVVDKIRVDAKEALFLAEGTLLIARKLRRKEEIALAMRAKANALYASGDNHGAVQHHEDAFKLYEALGIPKEAARTLSNSIQPLILLGEYDRALAASERAREIFTRIGETRRLASLDNNVGNIFHRQDRFKEAIAYYERAYKALSEFEDSEHVAVTLHNIAYLYYFRGEYSRAIEMLFATRRACEASGDAYHFALCHLDLSDIYLELNLSEEAREMAHEGFLRFEK